MNQAKLTITPHSTAQIIFDTRAARIPTYDQPLNGTEDKHNSTAMPAHPLVFENQYVQLSSALPADANIYGLGEYISGGFRRNPNNTVQPFFTLDAGDPTDSNMYGYHPVYLEVRPQEDKKVESHMVYFQSTSGLDVILRPKVIQYRAIGGTLDFRFFSGSESSGSDAGNSTEASGDEDAEMQADRRMVLDARQDNSTEESSSSLTSSPMVASSQYVSFIGKPLLAPLWSYGFHLCRWGYRTANQTLGVAKKMREHNIPLETIWNDIDVLDSFRDLTIAPDRFSQKDVDRLLNYLDENNQHYIPITDAAIPAAPTNESDSYPLGTAGIDQDVFIKNANGSTYIGQVWPGYTYFPSWFSNNTQDWWSEGIANFSKLVNFSGIWLDMNEPSSFCVGSCGTGQNLSTWFGHEPVTPVVGWPEGYDNYTYGDSGNITVKGKSTYSSDLLMQRRADGDGQDSGKSAKVNTSDYHHSVPKWNYQNDTQRYLSVPPYAIHNGKDGIYNYDNNVDLLNSKTVAMEAIDGDHAFYDVHNLHGVLFEKATYNALKTLRPNERPFLISRSTYPGAGKFSHHWLGDNFSLWASMSSAMQGLLQFQLFGIPLIGPDTCGFARNSGEELCNRWQMMSAMLAPFYRNHNIEESIAQEPYEWDSVANATRIANYKRLQILPYMYSTMARASQQGVPAIRALWQEFTETFVDTGDTFVQALFGPSLLVTPVLEPNVRSVKGYFPAAGGKWRSIFTYEALDVPENKNVSIPAPISTINAHMRPGAVMLTYAEPKYTTTETAAGPYGLLVNLNDEGNANGDAYVDDGVTPAPLPSRELLFTANNGSLSGSTPSGNYTIPQKLSSVLVLGVEKKPQNVSFGDAQAEFKFDDSKQMLNVTGLQGDLNGDWKLTWM